ncbi:transcriptional regulator [Skermanella stibiiresistens SB22]|jgi:DNA-binding transcriptional LysR family regulator|uniref:HTH-type transcriptional regulator CbbR n=1 Tax=Skermanella stibiiresistens SB22 TaxID=1385369 RepID=W9H652_9PROT|nr:LysR family transcriptional regulator [Skermanella stibiiresistens]EWY39238.1 transcriptional regulator [Skermanella stibiiresistens SB22]
MTLRHSTIRQLQVFVEAAHTLSFARVAERLGLTPAAVSFQIKQIEGLAGFALFERVGRRVVLTEAGASLLEYASVVLKALTDADERMRELKGLSGGHARIGLVSTAKYIMPRMLARFQTEYPRITIHLREGNRRDIIAALLSGDVDIAVMGKPPEDAEVTADPFAPHPSVIVAPPGHPLAGQAKVPLNALAEERFIVREEGSGTRALMENFFRGASFTPHIALTSSSNETIKQAVMAGMGVALISRHTIVLELRMGLVTVLPVEGSPLMRSWFVASRRNMPLLPVHIQLRRFLLAEGKSLIDGIESAYHASE